MFGVFEEQRQAVAEEIEVGLHRALIDLNRVVARRLRLVLDRGCTGGRMSDQCAVSTGNSACVRIWRVVPPKINCRSRLCV